MLRDDRHPLWAGARCVCSLWRSAPAILVAPDSSVALSPVVDSMTGAVYRAASQSLTALFCLICGSAQLLMQSAWAGRR
jgi:hypothetical protein